MDILSREDARKRGLKRYFTGNLCGKGHISERLVSNNQCIECRRLQKAKSRGSEGKPRQDSSVSPRQQAIANGDKYYYTGEPCKYGHISKRLTSTHACLACIEANKKPNKVKPKKPTKPLKPKRPPLSESQNEAASRSRHHLGRLRSTDKRGEPYHYDYEISEDVLGYTFDDLHSHLITCRQGWGERKNTGRWHIDHIIPVAELVRRDVTQPAIINSLNNLQLLLKDRNIKKSDTVDHLNETDIQKFIDEETSYYNARIDWAITLAEKIISVAASKGMELSDDFKKLKYACSWHYDQRHDGLSDITFDNLKLYVTRYKEGYKSNKGRKRKALIEILCDCFDFPLPQSLNRPTTQKEQKSMSIGWIWFWIFVGILLVRLIANN